MKVAGLILAEDVLADMEERQGQGLESVKDEGPDI